MTINSSTVSSNGGEQTGGIFNQGGLSINASTVYGNASSDDLQEYVGGISNGPGSTLVIGNTIVAGNVAGLISPVTDDVKGSFVSLGYNLIGNADESLGFGSSGDQLGTLAAPLDPLLGFLQNNGGPTETHALLPGSPAIEMGSNSLIPVGVLTDQRGFLRIVNAIVDIGSVEFGDVAPLLIDIKPGSTKNPVNPSSGGVLPVAILTTDIFDALTIDYETVTFGPDGAVEEHGRAHVQDVDDDGDMDLLLHFKIRDSGIACGDTEATLVGETYTGVEVFGSDAIVTLKCR